MVILQKAKDFIASTWANVIKVEATYIDKICISVPNRTNSSDYKEALIYFCSTCVIPFILRLGREIYQVCYPDNDLSYTGDEFIITLTVDKADTTLVDDIKLYIMGFEPSVTSDRNKLEVVEDEEGFLALMNRDFLNKRRITHYTLAHHPMNDTKVQSIFFSQIDSDGIDMKASMLFMYSFVVPLLVRNGYKMRDCKAPFIEDDNRKMVYTISFIGDKLINEIENAGDSIFYTAYEHALGIVHLANMKINHDAILVTEDEEEYEEPEEEKPITKEEFIQEMTTAFNKMLVDTISKLENKKED